MRNRGLQNSRSRRGFTLAELLVGKAVVGIAGLVALVAVERGDKQNLAGTVEKMRILGNACVAYTVDHGGLLPLEDAIGPDDWANAAKPGNSEVWYNALPKIMKEKSVGELGKVDPQAFYQEAYVLCLPGAPYSKEEKRAAKPQFAMAMNSRLQQGDQNDARGRTTLAMILDPVRTVLFLERGLPRDKKVSKWQRGFDGSPKASPRSFVCRHGGKGLLLFVDGHLEVNEFTNVVDEQGRIAFPQERMVWTLDPKENPN